MKIIQYYSKLFTGVFKVDHAAGRIRHLGSVIADEKAKVRLAQPDPAKLRSTNCEVPSKRLQLVAALPAPECCRQSFVLWLALHGILPVGYRDSALVEEVYAEVRALEDERRELLEDGVTSASCTLADVFAECEIMCYSNASLRKRA